jgi:hypothetical protein
VHVVAESQGYDPITYGRFVILGAPIRLHQEADESGSPCCFKTIHLPTSSTYSWNADPLLDYVTSSSSNPIESALEQLDWDVLLIQPYPKNGDSFESEGTRNAALYFADALYRGNPDGQVIIHPSHTGEYMEKSPAGDMQNIYEPLADLITSTYPNNKPAKVTPVHQAWDALMDAGYTNLWKSSSNTHSGTNGRFLMSCLIYSTAYGQDCAGSYHGETSSSLWNGSVNDDYANKIMDVAWQEVQNYSYSAPTSVNVERSAPSRLHARQSINSAQELFNLRGQRIPHRSTQTTDAMRTLPTGLYLQRGAQSTNTVILQD